MELRTQIEQSTAHRPVRDRISGLVLSNPGLFDELLSLALDVSDKNHHKACWNLELVLERNLDLLQLRLGEFCNALPSFTDESARRSISKICMFVCTREFGKKAVAFATENQLEQIASACFDWLISDAKVATKAYSMRALFLLGTRFHWIHPELSELLRKDFAGNSAAYRNAALDILNRLG